VSCSKASRNLIVRSTLCAIKCCLWCDIVNGNFFVRRQFTHTHKVVDVDVVAILRFAFLFYFQKQKQQQQQ